MQDSRFSTSQLTLLITCFLLTLVLSNQADAQEWFTCSGPEGSTVSTLTVSPTDSNTIYAGAKGVFKSSDAGNSWTAMCNGLGDVQYRGLITSIAVDPRESTTVYAAVHYHGIYKTIDGGETWIAVNDGLSNLYVNSVAIDPHTAGIVYVSTSYGGVFKSTNSGVTWVNVLPYTADPLTSTLTTDPHNPGTIYVGTAYDAGVYKSTDSGLTWDYYSSDFSTTYVYSLNVDPNTPNTIFAGTDNGIYKSIDGGESWSVVAAGSSIVHALNISTSTNQSGVAYALSLGVFKTTDGGNAWSQTSFPYQYGKYETFSMAIDPVNSDNIYTGYWHEGIYKSTDGGATSSTINSGLNAQIRSLSIGYDGSVYAETVSGLYKRDGVWLKILEPDSRVEGRNVSQVEVSSLGDHCVFVGGPPFRFKYSCDGGESWTDIHVENASAFALDPANEDVMYVAALRGLIYKSTTRGQSWELIYTPADEAYIQTLLIDPITPQTIYAFGPDKISKSIDGGLSWSLITLPQPKSLDFDMVVSPDSGTLYAANGDNILESVDGGNTWAVISTTPSPIISISVDPNVPAKLITGSENGIYISLDGGVTWAEYQGGLTSKRGWCFAYDPNRAGIIYIGTDHGVFVNTGAPTAYAGPDQHQIEGATVILDGSLSSDPDNGIASYLWSQTGGQTVQLSDVAAAKPTFTAPEVGPDGESLTFQLIVTDYDGLQDANSVVIFVNSGDPIANAGSDQDKIEGSIVTLDGSNSTDPDDGIATYYWEQIGGTLVALSDPAAIQPTFTAPEVGPDGESLIFQLTVTDHGDHQAIDSVVINVFDRGGGGAGSGGGCLVATAAYGSSMAEEVVVLRRFRDDVLLQSAMGESIVKFYYSVSPSIADYLEEHELFRVSVRAALFPVVFAIKYPISSALVFILFIIGLIQGVRLIKRKKARTFQGRESVAEH